MNKSFFVLVIVDVAFTKKVPKKGFFFTQSLKKKTKTVKPERKLHFQGTNEFSFAPSER